MEQNETVVFKLPKAEYRTGKVVGNYRSDEGVEMPVVSDHLDSEYPVHPGNIRDVGNAKWENQEVK